MLFATPNKKWDALSVSKELRSNESAATIQLEDLRDKGLLVMDDSHHFLYHPINDELHEKVKILLNLYHDKPVAIVACIYERPQDKLKGFANAFRIKRD